MRKTVSICMLLIANMIILTHAVIPHHHHDKVAVAIVRFCENNITHEHLFHNNEAHHHESSEDCFMTEAVSCAIVKNSNNEIKLLCNILQINLKPLLLCNYLAVKNTLNTEALLYLRHPFRQKPHLTNTYFAFIASQFGFRAPPFAEF